MSSHSRISAPSPSSDASRALKAAADEISGLFMGPMPVERFLDQFLPPRPDPPITSSAFGRSFNKSGRGQIVEKIVDVVAKLLPSWLVTHTPHPDPTCDISLDVGVYHKGLETGTRTDLSQVELFINIDDNRLLDPFDDSQPTSSTSYFFERNNEKALSRKTRDSACVGAMCVLQARTHTFSVLISGSSARLLRWDPSGVLVTKAFAYASTDWLIDFLWRFDALSPSERGLDLSIAALDAPWPTDLAPEDVLEHLKNHQATTSSPRRHRCFAIMKVPDRDDSSTEYDFLVSWPPRYTKCPPFGRATRPLLAYDIEAHKLVFTKQYWRNDNSQKEGEVYRRLADNGVRRLPVFGRGNDVRELVTVTPTFEPEEMRSGWYRHTRPLTKYRLYRMSLDTVGSALSEFKSTRQLVTALRDVMICHDDAFFKAGILHGDISPNNILIHPDDNGGFLTDWDSSIDTTSSAELGAPRRGTWQFISAGLLQRASASHELRDDRESAFWVLLWNVLVHTSYRSPRTLDSWMTLFDERLVNGSGPPVGGDSKLDFLRFPTAGDSIESTASPCLNILIPQLKELFAIRYAPALVNPHLPVSKVLMAAGRDVPSVAEYDAHQNQKAKLSEEGTIVDILNDALDDPTLWPGVDDPALPDISIHGKPLSRKRSADIAGLRRAFNPSKPSRSRKESPPPSLPVASPTNPAPPLAKPRKKVVVAPSDRVLRPRPSPPEPALPPTTRKKSVKPSEPKTTDVPSKKRDAPAKPRPSRKRT